MRVFEAILVEIAGLHLKRLLGFGVTSAKIKIFFGFSNEYDLKQLRVIRKQSGIQLVVSTRRFKQLIDGNWIRLKRLTRRFYIEIGRSGLQQLATSGVKRLIIQFRNQYNL
ncbi:hypothetical protein SAMN03080599_02222 [Acidaminobacter hydrogenoformans DSM 2784]|uniref:Uncharacterized protein n=1 Tax=Acidaminobacter hydrogenoformans DSM 2784 TaxID=1120920 RepID=A0A1G5S1U7_9FIRM|nr:hypothetical protein SAMN03080599_02222 [Acidaminobacter hydrogenoformans DSM 2784]